MTTHKTIDEWAEQELAHMKRFANYWKENAERDRKNFPHCMNHGEWDEQYWDWCANTLTEAETLK